VFEDKAIIEYLTKTGFIGQLYPVSTKSEARTIIGVLVSTVDQLIDQIDYRFGVEMTKSGLMAMLDRNNISVFRNMDEFVKAKERAALYSKDMLVLDAVRKRHQSFLAA
jgi:hypothetical protein